MRAFALALALALAPALVGCIAPATPPAGCEVPAIGTTGSRIVHVQVANTMDRAACVHVRFDGAVVAGKELAAEHPGLHANPGPVGDLRWPGSTVLVRIEEPGTDRAYEERVTLGAETWVVGWLGESGGNVETYDREPMWM